MTSGFFQQENPASCLRDKTESWREKIQIQHTNIDFTSISYLSRVQLSPRENIKMLFKSVFLVIVLTTEFSHDTSALVTEDGSSICHESYSVAEPEYVSYRETYRRRSFLFYRTDWRWNYRLKYNVVYKTREICCDGYENIGSKICRKRCSEGYQLNSNFVCEPICDPVCQNGDCTSPNTCTCSNGYEQSLTEINVCVAICDRPCINADCVAPDQCECHAGYNKIDDDFFCQPQCIDDCILGTCTAPDVCTCNDGYQKVANMKNYCEPLCHETCVLGTCIAPDVCSCFDGHYPISSSTCAPLCDNGCINGECIEPNVCRCNDGYVENFLSNGICEPVCTKPCEHGICTRPDTCLCNVGFKHNETAWNLCDPFCAESCVNAHCVAPETCICYEGYRKSTSDNVCEAICQENCVNGNCIAPETCECNNGYEKTGIANICEPVCENCSNGNCTEPNVCTCFEGYEKDSNGTCVPSCDCINGTCIAPDTCQCNPGFTFARGNATLCLPQCNAGCINGECIEPNVCTCYDGFVKLNDSTDGICIEACQNGSCQHGNCQFDGYCQCYYGWNERTCDTPVMCLLILKEDAGDFNETGQNDVRFESPWNGPMCDDSCWENIDNETLCYNDTTRAIPRVACFLKADSGCKFLDLNAASLLRNSNIIGASSGIIILILGTTVGLIFFLKYRKNNKNNFESAVINQESLNTLLREDSYNEPHDEIIS